MHKNNYIQIFKYFLIELSCSSHYIKNSSEHIFLIPHKIPKRGKN